MKNIEKIAQSIKKYREQEIKANIRHPAFGRSDGRFNNDEQTFWIVLSQHSSGDALTSNGNDISVSRDAPLGAILIQNYDGEHSYTVRGKFRGEVYENTIKIYNRAKYVPTFDEDIIAYDIVVNISNDKNTYLYRNLSELISKLAFMNQEIRKTQEGLDKVIIEQEEAQNILVKAESERKEAKEILLAIAEQKRKEAEDLRGKLEKEKQKQQSIVISAQKFIRQNAELRWQPILDPKQDAIKREKIFDGGTLVINGGPGTGKTTSLIQRIKFLTSSTIEEYITLSTKQKEILYNQRTSWIFFSPSKLLALFLKNSMAKEGLIASDNTVKVWGKQRDDIIRLYGWVEEENRAFRFYRPDGNQTDHCLFNNQRRTIEMIHDFEKYYLKRQLEKLQNKADVNDHQISNSINDIENLLQECLKIEMRKKQMETQGKNKEIDDDAIFNKICSTLLNDIPATYKLYRKEQYKQENKDWNIRLLDGLLKDNGNSLLHQDERSFLICFVNIFCRKIYKRFSSYWQGLKHPCISTYRAHCKPVIAIDEATDFSAIDLLAMHSLGHPEFSSITLSGDLLQRMTINGIREWDDFSNAVESLKIENLTISYRQSPTLLSLAQKIYQYSTNKNAEYISYIGYNPIEPKPLMKISGNTKDKIKWIADRVREIDVIYRQSVGSLPSVAVFVPEEEHINDFVNNLNEQLEGDIPVLGCPNGMVLGDSSDVRVYSIDKIKGLEFEAVFFHNLDQLEKLQNNLLLKYLYVGLSRATFYLGVTLSKKVDNNLHFIEEYFEQNGNWQLKIKVENSEAEINGA
ncbi:ATP-binding domain-containing protein [Treponema sp. TIM-1]|uniref:ATP-binding domain-containing protein n=1 Tax=Treponema sp. TIM-1 TaxID=2898417 RepID=UPI00398191AF